jgi:hypothetical protein
VPVQQLWALSKLIKLQSKRHKIVLKQKRVWCNKKKKLKRCPAKASDLTKLRLMQEQTLKLALAQDHRQSHAGGHVRLEAPPSQHLVLVK